MINKIMNPQLGYKVKQITTVNITWCLGEELWESLLLPSVYNNEDHEK